MSSHMDYFHFDTLQSLINKPTPFALVFFSLFVTCTFLRNPYGELSRALGMALILALQRTRSIRNQYPTWPHVKACLATGPRIPTDPNDHPLLQSVLSMTFVGMVVGANLPLLPTWMGAVAGGASLAMVTTLPTANGDLARSMGMRVVSLLEEVWIINSELNIMSKLGVVSGKIFDHIMILDRKHRIKDKIVTIVSFAYVQVARTVQNVQSEMGQDDEQDDIRRDSSDRRNDRAREGAGGRRDDRERGGDRRDDRERGGDRRDDPRR